MNKRVEEPDLKSSCYHFVAEMITGVICEKTMTMCQDGTYFTLGLW